MLPLHFAQRQHDGIFVVGTPLPFCNVTLILLLTEGKGEVKGLFDLKCQMLLLTLFRFNMTTFFCGTTPFFITSL